MWVLRYLPRYVAVGVDHGRGVVVDPGRVAVLLVHRHHEDHAQLLGQGLHPLGGRAVGDELGVAVVLRILDLAEVGAVEELLEEHHLGALLRRLVGVALVLLDHRLLVAGPARLQERTSDVTGHGSSFLVLLVRATRAIPRTAICPEPPWAGAVEERRIRRSTRVGGASCAPKAASVGRPVLTLTTPDVTPVRDEAPRIRSGRDARMVITDRRGCPPALWMERRGRLTWLERS